MAEALTDLFISYAHVDRDFVQRLAADLQQQGLRIWVDQTGLAGGQQWRRELQEAIDRAGVLLVVLSPEAVSSPYVQNEYGYATDEGKLVIPLYYRPCKVPLELRGTQWIDFQHSYEQSLSALLHALQPHDKTTPATASAASLLTHQPASAPAAAPAAVERPWNVPFARNPFFTGRGPLLEALHRHLSSRQPTTLTPSAALSGLGGMGKTQTAIEYAYRYRDEYSAVLWVRADSREILLADYVALARLLSLPGHDAQEQMQVVVTVKRWLQEHEGWLLILDNADDLRLLPDFLPRGGKGHLLLTTRAQATGKLAKSLLIDKLEVSEGLHLLLHRAKLLAEDEPLETVSAAERKAAQQVVEEVDGLPLALDQAGAYLEETECSLSDYLALYTRRRLALLKRESTLGSDYPHTVASTWALSFSQVEQADPAAADLLRVCAFLHPDAIPEAILTAGAAELGPRLQDVAVDPLLLNEAIQLLRRYSLIKRDPEANLLNLHRLVQVVLKESLDAATQQQWAERTVRAVNAAFPQEDYPAWEQCERLLPHALRCAELMSQYDFHLPQAARLLHAAGNYLVDRRQYAQAEPLLEQALAMRERTLGREHAETASTLNQLAWLYVISGNYQQAERLVQPALASYERVLGPAHLEVASALHTLGDVYNKTGRYGQAEPLLQRALAIREHTLGPTHLDVAESLNDLANLYGDQGKYAQAEPLYQRALALDEQALGAEHPETLTVTGNLAVLLYDQGKYAQAEALLQRVLAITERVLGAEHPETLDSLVHLGRLRVLQGQYQQAEALLQQVHALLERVLGAEHNWTLRAVLSLADLSQAQQQEAQAAALYQQALTGFEHLLGPEHPRVAETLTGLAQLSIRQGHYEQAESLLQRALAIDEHVLGAEHPQTATALDAQGYLALVQGREEQAEALLQRALSIREQALGPDHPDVAVTLQHLAELSEKQGKSEQAEALYSQALSIREQVLGAEHPTTLATRQALARLLQPTHSQAGSGSITPPQAGSAG